ncbi:MAG: porin family protein [Chitinophagaceae bacterium]
MKTKWLFLSLLLIAGYTTSAQVSLGVQGGVVRSNISGDQSELTFDTKPQSKFSWQAGLIADIPLGESGFRFIPELKYVNKGFKANTTVDFLGQTTTIDGSSSIGYIELPINFGYALDLGGAQLVLGAGPYLGYGIGGKNKFEAKVNGTVVQSVDEKVQFGSAEDEIKPFDYGANFLAGILFGNGLMVKANYGLGLANLSNVPNSTAKNNYLGLSLVYFVKRAGE